jgi:hypothetical protein
LIDKKFVRLAGKVLSVQLVPDYRADKTKDISDRTGDHDERNGSHRIEWLNEIDRLDHVRPENEIDNWLRPPKQHENRPEHVPTAKQDADDEPELVRISHRSSL